MFSVPKGLVSLFRRISEFIVQPGISARRTLSQIPVPGAGDLRERALAFESTLSMAERVIVFTPM